MKTLKLFFIALLICNSVSAQKEIVVTAVNKEMSRGMQPGFMVSIPEVKLKDINPAYKKQLEANTKANAKEVNGEFINYGVVNKNFSVNPFIVYAKSVETIDGVDLTIFITEDSLSFLSETGDPDKVAAIKKSLHDFAVVEYKKVVTKQLEVENDKLSTLKKTLSTQVNDESDNTKDISSKNREIENYKSKIEENKSAQGAKTEQIGSQQKLADGISNKQSPEHELAVKNLKKYEGEKKDLIKAQEKMHRNIDDNNSEIRELEQENETLKRQQEDSKKKIEDQEAVVKQFENKLNGIK